MSDYTRKTAITRKRLPAPTQWLLNQGILKPGLAIVDYGCGKCHEINNLHFVADGYDPYFRPDGLKRYHYDIIISNFVLNVIESWYERFEITQRIRKLMADEKSLAFISVRNDSHKLNGWTKRGTWQGYVTPVGELIKKTASYRLYKLSKEHVLPRLD